MKKILVVCIACIFIIFAFNSCAENCAGTSHAEEIDEMIASFVANPTVAVTKLEITTYTTIADFPCISSNTNNIRVGITTNSDTEKNVPNTSATNSRPLQIEIVFDVSDSNISSSKIPLIYKFIDLDRYYSEYVTESDYYYNPKYANIFEMSHEEFVKLENAFTGDYVDSFYTTQKISKETVTSGQASEALECVENALWAAQSDSSSLRKLHNSIDNVIAPDSTQSAIENTSYVLQQLAKWSDLTIIKDFREGGKRDVRKLNAASDALLNLERYFGEINSRAINRKATKQDLISCQLAQTYANQYANVFVEMFSESSKIIMTKTSAQYLVNKAQRFDIVADVDYMKIKDYVSEVLSSVLGS